MIEYILINGCRYKSIKVVNFEDIKLLKNRIKNIKCKIRTYENGTTINYKNYPILLEHLENNLKDFI
jgi:ribosomal protein S18